MVENDFPAITDPTTVLEWGNFPPSVRNNPYPLFESLRKSGAVHLARMPKGELIWLVIGYSEARQVLADDRFVQDARRLGGTSTSRVPNTRSGFSLDRNLLNLDPPDHTRLRRLVSAAFSERSARLMKPFVKEACQNALAAMDPHTSADLIAEYATPVSLHTICHLLAVPAADRELIHKWSTRIIAGTSIGDEVSYVKAVTQMADYLQDLVSERIRQRGTDIISEMISQLGHIDSEKTVDEINGMTHLMLVAGHETSINLIGNSVAVLLQDDRLRNELIEDPSRVASFVEETLRYESPIQHATFRYAAEDTPVGNSVIPRGSPVLVVIAAANRDEAYFPNPHTFDLRNQQAGRHLGFGHGVHFCLGAPLARIEGISALSSLLEKYPNVRLDDGGAGLPWRPGLLHRGLDVLHVALEADGRAHRCKERVRCAKPCDGG
ncbi:cytochrome P450 family protein [Streptomyces chartreusis]|uniref:cytochrome P450 family protein n=1 Tax=Streptomyces chartreusis TaxID=1969 RepID=UPI0037F75D8F